MGLLLALLLSQVDPAPCNTDGGVWGAVCSTGGYESSAALNYGSGTPDFLCGNPDDGGVSQSKYCMFRSRVNSDYAGYHGDFTFQGLYPRKSGWLFQHDNSYFGGAVFGYDYHGDIWSYGVKGLQVQENGAGVWNQYSYVGLRGNSQTRGPGGYADVVVQPSAGAAHADGGFVFDVWNGPAPNLRVRDDGALDIAGKTYRFDVVDAGEVLRISYERPDGGVAAFDVHSAGP
jgi:hypothetical protein